MKTILFFLFTVFTSMLSAATHQDSVGVFHRPEKVIVLVNEGPEGRSRLSDMMDFFNIIENQFQITSSDKNLRISCGRQEVVASCTFIFLTGKDVVITSKKLETKVTLSDLNLKAQGYFEFYFESSMADKFILKINGSDITFLALKKPL